MNAYEILRKKRDGSRLSPGEIQGFIESLVKGRIPDYVASAFLMAVFIRGMDDGETLSLTQAMIASGTTIDPSSMPGPKVDKHSTGGVGDKVSLILAPLVAACGVKVPMISGRSLGHTGGTLDKLESIPGFRTGLSISEFTANVNRVGVAIAGQSEELVPADMKLYALRDVTGTVESIPLIASSIMSKKLAEGIDGLVLDIKVGNGAFMKTDENAGLLGDAVLKIGAAMGKKVSVLLTDMSQPLGGVVGNAIEVREAIDVLRGGGPADLVEVVYLLGEQMLVISGKESDTHSARRSLKRCIDSGQAIEKFREMVDGQGGDARCIDDPEMLDVAAGARSVESDEEGFVQEIDTYSMGSALVELGGGRRAVGEEVDRSAGLIVHKKIGSHVERGEPLVTALCDDPRALKTGAALLESAYRIRKKETAPPALLHGIMKQPAGS